MTFRTITRGVAAMTLCAMTAACSSNSSSETDGGAVRCATPDGLKIVFSPMYSAVIPGPSGEGPTFSLPVIVPGLSGSEVSWHASDPSAVSVVADMPTGGALLTMLPTAKNPGAPVTVTAVSKTACGTATLSITPATMADWSVGEARYNDRVGIDGGNRAACTDCHAPHGDAGQGFNDVAHTPEQAGGFSDVQLLDIIQNAQIPDGGYFDPSIVTYKQWQQFHHWNLSLPEQTGIVVYLRSLLPTAQGGTASFGGLGAPDGG